MFSIKEKSMKISQDNNPCFKACYRVPYTNEGYNKLQKVLKFEKPFNCLPVYSKSGSAAKDIVLFTHPFPYEHSYDQALISALFNNHQVSDDEAEKFGIKLNIFKRTRISMERWSDILNYRLDIVRNKGIDVNSVGRRDYFYVTTNEDSKIVWDFMASKIKEYIEPIFGDKKMDYLEYTIKFASAMLNFTPVPKYQNTEPKQNFIQRLFKINEKIKKKKIALLDRQYQELLESLKNENLNKDYIEEIQQQIDEIQARIDSLTEPAYIKKARFLAENFNKEKERFNKIFFENREITSVDSVEDLIEKL